jgi:hypothetical protein
MAPRGLLLLLLLLLLLPPFLPPFLPPVARWARMARESPTLQMNIRSRMKRRAMAVVPLRVSSMPGQECNKSLSSRKPRVSLYVLVKNEGEIK